MQLNWEAWQALFTDEGRRLVTEAGLLTPGDVTGIGRLRKHWPAEQVAAALELCLARRKAPAKFPDDAETLVADVQGLEQATGIVVGLHKAKRFAQLGVPVLDVCCGIGGDAMALTRTGVPVIALDIDPTRAWMTGLNAGCPTVVADADTFTDGPADAAFHLDPGRRGPTGRTHRLADYQPGPELIARWIAGRAAGGVKLGPGVDPDEALQLATGPAELEWISDHGRLVQAMLWTGTLAQGTHTATRLPEGVSLRGEPAHPPVGETGQYIYLVDPAVERSGLLNTLCEAVDAPMIHPSLGLLTADRVIESPWLTGFEVLDTRPWQVSKPSAIRSWLRSFDAGPIEIKTRGKAIDPDVWQKRLHGNGSQPVVLFVHRWDRRVVATLTRRMGGRG